MTISVIVATLNRPEHVRVLLKSLSENTRLPDEVVIVEQGNLPALESVVQDYNKIFPIRLLFESQKSLAVARDRGQKAGLGDVLIFCDDDIEFNTLYIQTVFDYLSENGDVLGMTGSYMFNTPAWTIKRFFGLLFGVYSLRQANVVLPSGCYDYVRGPALNKLQIVEWLYGCNMVLRRNVFEIGFRFYTKFTRWSFGEDVMFSYPIHRRFPNTLRYHPKLKVFHNQGSSNKMVNVEALRMRILYRYIFWRREVYQGQFFNFLAYLWSQIGLSGLEMTQQPSLTTAYTLIKSYKYLYFNHKKIFAEQVNYNDFILDK